MSGGGIVASLRGLVESKRANSDRLVAAHRAAEERAEQLDGKVEQAHQALASGAIDPAAGLEALNGARADHAAALADVEALRAAAEIASARADGAEAEAEAKAEAARQAAILARAEKFYSHASEAYRAFLSHAAEAAAASTLLSNGGGGRFDLATLMGYEARRAVAGAERTLEVDPRPFGVRLPPLPEVNRLAAETAAEWKRQREAMRPPATAAPARHGEAHPFEGRVDRPS